MRQVRTQAELDAALRDGEYPELIGNGSFIVVGSSRVTAYGSSQVTAYGSSRVTAYGSSQVTAYGSSQVTAYGSSQVTACGSSQVRACDSSQVRAYGSSQVTAYGSSQVTAYGSSQVTAYGSSQVRAYGSSQVTASKQVAVTRHSLRAKVAGGVLIEYKQPANVAEWLENYGGNEPDASGVVVLYKAVDNNFVSSRSFSYVPGTVPRANDWDGGKDECGKGLHFVAHPSLGLQFKSDATRFVACPVKVAEIVVHPDAKHPSKAKAPGCCAPVWEVDINGNAIADKEKGGK